MRQIRGAIKQQGAAVTEKQLMIITATIPQPYVASWQGTACGNGDFIEIQQGNTSHTSQTMLFQTHSLAIFSDVLRDLHRGILMNHVTTLETMDD